MSNAAYPRERTIPVTVTVNNQAAGQAQAMAAQRKVSTMDDIGEKLVGMLDEIERRVENLRETATVMEMEKDALLEMLNTVQMNKDMLHLRPGEKEDIEAHTNRLLGRCKTVDVTVNTPRNYDQERSLRQVNDQVEELVQKMKDDITATKQTCKRYLNACQHDQPDGPIDQRFQSALIGCAAEDQKKIKRRLESLLSLFDRADKTVAQAQP